MADTKSFIEDLILQIETTEVAGSVTNEMVARIFTYLMVELGEVTGSTAVADEATARAEADAAIRQSITNLNTALRQEITNVQGTLGNSVLNLSNRLDNVLSVSKSDYIDTINEVLRFLDGIKDSETLLDKLAELRDEVAALDDAVKFGMFNGFVNNVTCEMVGIPGEGCLIYWDSAKNYWVASRIGVLGKYYNAFSTQSEYEKENRIYVDASTGDCYRYTAAGLVAMGVTKEQYERLLESIQAVEELVNKCPALDASGKLAASVIPDEFDEVIPMTWYLQETVGSGPMAAITAPPIALIGAYCYFAHEKKLYVGVSGAVNAQGLRQTVWQEVTPSNKKLYLDLTNARPYIWKNNDMVAIAADATPASTFNVTVAVPIQGYYSLVDQENESASAVHAAWNAKKAVSGLIMSFEIGAGVWKTYQYIGRNVNQTNWMNPENWKDFGSLAAGSETYVVIDQLVGPPAVGSFYTLATAVQALLKYQQDKGVTYAKKGLIISYGVAANEMETKQFQGEISDIGEVGLWKDFGGGGKVETKDETEKDGKDALSTGAGHILIPTNLHIDTETEGVVKLSMVNAEGETVGDEAQFQVGTGGGGSFSGTIVSASFEHSPMFGNAGSPFIARAAVRSVSTSGTEEQLNNIEKVELYDRDTNTLLDTFVVNKASSASLDTYDFEFDLSSYMVNAGTRRFRFVFIDDGGNTGSRNINLTAVDVTISSVQTLNYTPATTLEVGGSSRSIPLYKFANNANQIKATTEIFINGQWKVLNEQVVKDTYSVALTIDPNNCVGQRLAHGVYALRIHGEDITSGVIGNYLHTSLMVIGTAGTPIVATRWYSNEATATAKLYESIRVEYAVYDPNTTSALAQVFLDSALVSSHVAYRTNTYSYEHQVTGVAYDGSKTLSVAVKSASATSPVAYFRINGSVIDALLKVGAIYAFDFANRSNEDEDKSIKSGAFEITATGSNYSTTGFSSFLGARCFRAAEGVKLSLNHHPYSDASVERTGSGIQFCFASKNLPDDNAVLMKCYDENEGVGFYVTGKAVGIYCANSTTNKREERFYKQGEKVTVAVVVEPAAEGLGVTRGNTTYYFIKLYLNGEEVAAIGYEAGKSSLIQDDNITIDGSVGDFYLYYITAWQDHFQFDQAFQNYLVKMTDTDDMVTEYNFEDVMAAQQVYEYGGTTIKSRPQATELYNRGMAYFVECPYNGSNIESLDNTTSTDQNMYVTLYYFDPARPWTNFVAYDVRRRNQGTTSAKRPVKNPRYYLAAKNGSSYNKTTKKGGTWMMLLNPDPTTERGRIAIELAKCNKMQLFDDSIPIDTITVKLDYSDSSNANDCGVCDQMNATYRALGGDYLTPPQRAYDGTWSGKYKDAEGNEVKVNLTGLKMNHSTANKPAAMFRSSESTGVNPYFHAKGNWKEDKKEQVALGFKDTPGYNKGCLNYGDFTEYYGREGESLAQTKARFLQESSLVTDSVYILTQYCGRSYKVMRYKNGAWTEQTGSMRQVNGKWVVTGDVMNPTDGFELLNYQGMDWFKGVSSVAEMMAPTTSFSKWVQQLIDKGNISIETAPAWTYYFECLLDDDNLAIAYAEGKKVPYNLFEWLVFCDQCDTDKRDRATALKKWHDELYKYASPHSVLSYDVFTDYDAATDQRAKNMQPMWFLEDGAYVENGEYHNSLTIGCNPIRMYLNKIYDCDTCNGKDNDGGQTVDAETDPNRMSDDEFTNPYAGYGSILFRNVFMQPSVLTAAGSVSELNLQSVASAMRSCTATVGGVTLRPFSPEGAEYFFLKQRIKRWQKKLSSYDGERKYIQFTGTSDTIYFYALQGLGMTSLPAFIERRWRYRDGFFGVGNFFSGVISGRVNAPAGARIHIRAAKSGYFGIGNDSSGSITEKVYLEAGQDHYFTEFSHEEGALLYIYQADRMSMLDLSEITLSDNFAFDGMTLVEDLRLGSSTYRALTIGSYSLLTTTNLGELPFLRELHLEKTGLTNVSCGSCPRLESVYAAGSQLQRLDIADGANVTYLQLPAAYNYLRLRYLPKLTIDGLVLEDMRNISTLIVEQCSKLSAWELLTRIASTSGSKLKAVRALPINEHGEGEQLNILASLDMRGFDATLTLQDHPAIIGKYRMTTYKEESVIKSLQAALPELAVKNALYSDYVMHDLETDPKNVTNEDNKTGWKYGKEYEPSGYIRQIRKYTVPTKATPNADGSAVRLALLRKSDNTKYADGSAFDATDNLGEGYDVLSRVPNFFYKGINDFKNQEKHLLLSYGEEPERTWEKKNAGKLADLLYRAGRGISLSSFNVGDTLTEELITPLASTSVYRLDVEGMKQVRYYGMNHAQYGGVFVNAAGKVIEKALTTISGTTNSPLDFDANTDYLFRSVPSGAKYFYFTAFTAVDQELEAFAVDTDDIEAIEPEWVHHHADLLGVYGLVMDDLVRGRSISGRVTRRGTGTQVTSSEWTYDREGNPTNTPVSAMNYTYQDLLNVCRVRGKGYHAVSYEQSKILALLSIAWTGNRDDQSVYGFGTSAGYTTGTRNTAGMDSKYGVHSGVNKVWNIEGAIACNWELMDFIGANINGFKNWKSLQRPATGPTDGFFHIYDPHTDTERKVKGLTSGGGNNIARLKWGKFCDILPSSTSTDTSKYVMSFCAGYWISMSGGRCVGRANHSAYASGGLVCAYANSASTYSDTSFGSRLAFSGTILNDAEIDAQVEQYAEEYEE